MPYAAGVYTPPTGAENAAPGQVIRSATWNTIFTDLSTTFTDIGTPAIEFVINGGGQPILTGLKGFLEIPFNCTILSWKLMCDKAGSIVLDVWSAPFGSFPPTSGNSITGSAQPQTSSAQSASSAALTGWTTTVTAGAIFGFNVNSNNAIITQVTLSLDVGRN